MDVKSAFLHGNIKETIYMKRQKHLIKEDNNKVYKWLKSLYGLKLAPHEWNAKFNEYCESLKLERWSMKMLEKVYLLNYVDYIITASNWQEEIDGIINKLKNNLRCKMREN